MKQSYNSLKPEEILISNLKVLGFDPLIHAKNKNLVIDKNVFTAKQNAIRAFETITYFLFDLMDKNKTKRLFGDIWPITSEKNSLIYRNRTFAWLMEIRPGTPLEHVPLRRSYLVDCRGEIINKIAMAFSTHVLRITGRKKNAVDTSFIRKNKSTIEQEISAKSEQFKDIRIKINTSQKRWNEESADLVSQIEHLKQKIQPRTYNCPFATHDIIRKLEQQDYNVKIYQEKKKLEEFERIKQERLRQEQLELERLKFEQLEKERLIKLEQQRIERERLERIEQERIERERLERLERERLEKERIEKERLIKLEQQRIERERLERIEQERIEKERLERLEKERLEKERLEKERLEKERIERDRIEKERIEKERIEKERIEKERIEKERIEKERIEKERIEKERLEKERCEKERLERIEQERVEKERIMRIERERIERERLERMEQDRIQREKHERIEQERLEQERIEQERIRQELIEQKRIEQERVEQERIVQERIEQERIEQERIRQKLIEQKRIEQERVEQERVEQERVEQERIEQELIEQERIEQERIRQKLIEQKRIEQGRIEQERIEQELIEQERIEQERIEQERIEQERIEQNIIEEECLKLKQRLELERIEQELIKKRRIEKERIEKARIEQERIEKERIERELIEKEFLQLKQRLEQERIDQERIDRERIEKQRIEKERIEKERIEKERIEKQRIEKERIEKERTKKKRAQRERIQRERIEKERIEMERVKKERAEKERIEQERLEQERLKQELLKREQFFKRPEKRPLEDQEQRFEVKYARKSPTVQKEDNSKYSRQALQELSSNSFKWNNRQEKSEEDTRKNDLIQDKSLPRATSPEVYPHPTKYSSLVHTFRKPTDAMDVYQQISHELKKNCNTNPHHIIPPLPRKLIYSSPSQSVSFSSPIKAPTTNLLPKSFAPKLTENDNAISEKGYKPSSSPIIPRTEFTSPSKKTASSPKSRVSGSPIRASEQLMANHSTVQSSSPANRGSLSPFPADGTFILPAKVHDGMYDRYAASPITYSPQRPNVQGIDDDNYDFDIESVIDIQLEQPPEWTPLRMKTPMRFWK